LRERTVTVAQETAVTGERTEVKTVFLGLMLGMLIASISQTIVAPAMPRIVAELGGIEHYSWIALAALLASAVAVPIVGKFSDLYGRKQFYAGGIVVFLIGSILSGVAQNFWMLVAARVVQGLGMGTVMPLSQAIIGDVIAPRERGKYQGLMGGVFGLSSILGPLVGGYITDNFSWRWLFFVNLPVGIIALAVILRYMHLPHVEREHSIDYWGIATLSIGLVATLLATSWGGTQYPWDSSQIIGLYGLGALSLVLFVFIEARAPEPILPFALWRNSIFTFSNLANMAIAMGMFGAIYFLPVFIQGVIGRSATNSGLLLIPLTIPMIVMSIVHGQIISRTGRYKSGTLLGIALMGVGFYLLTRLDVASTNRELVRDMIVLGLGLGMAMQTFTLIVQNAVSRRDMGVATSTTQLFRSIGSTVGIAVMGTLMTTGVQREIPKRLPSEASAQMQVRGQEISAGAALDPAQLAQLPPEVLAAVRAGLAAALHNVFTAGLPFVVLAFVATLFIREIPLRRTAHADADDAGKGVLLELNQASADDEPMFGQLDPEYQARTRLLGITFALLAEEASDGDARPLLREVVDRLGSGERERGLHRLQAFSLALVGESAPLADSAPDALQRLLAEIDAGSSERVTSHDPRAEFERALHSAPPEVWAKLHMVAQRADGHEEYALTPNDVEALERLALSLAAALVVDLATKEAVSDIR
jgi:EmrB/QacA subfamily drug resistance transporter